MLKNAAQDKCTVLVLYYMVKIIEGHRDQAINYILITELDESLNYSAAILVLAKRHDVLLNLLYESMVNLLAA